MDPPSAGRLDAETLVDYSDDAMATLGVDGTITTWNPAAARLLGYSAEEAVGSRMTSFLVPEKLMIEPPHWLATVAAGGSVEEEIRGLRKDGGEVPFAMQMLPVRDAAQRVIGSVWLARDATDGRRRDALRRDGEETQRWRRQIDHALAEDYFIFAAQPIVNLRSGEVDHHELLLRMLVGGGEEVAPGTYIPIAEQSGQILAIDTWAARRGIELAARFPVAINLSGRSIASPSLIVEIERGLESSTVDPGSVTFEITETAAAADIDAAVDLIGRLRVLGCGVALDDFGTGFGSLTYLKRLKVTELKIDREFVSSALESEGDQQIVSTIVSIARHFRLKTVAEGIENGQTKQLLDTMGVDLAQGHFFGRPRALRS